MTSFAFILGVVPLWTAPGAGSVARQIIGTTVIGGMLAASAFGIFLIPAIFYVVERLSGAAKERTATVTPQEGTPTVPPHKMAPPAEGK
jgi:HAE1 family hydrophobic/amphiphilic exporter-1